MTTSAADDTAQSTEPPTTPPTGAPAAEQGWTRGTAAYPPTGNFPGGYPGTPHFGLGTPPPPSFDTPGYGYGYSSAPAWPQQIEGPKAWPVAVFTLLFGLFGAISAARRSSDARALGLPGGRYWAVFAGALVGGFAIWTLVLGVLIAITVPLYQASKSSVMTPTALEQQLEASSTTEGSVNDATCAEEAVDATGTGTYQCLISFSDGSALPYRITVADDGSWAAAAAE